MSNYLPSVKASSEFDGDTVTYTLEPIENNDFGKLLPFFKEGEDGEQKIAFSDQAAFMAVAGELLGKYASNFAGLTDASGAEVPLETAVCKSYFLGLVSDMVGQLFNASMVQEVEGKNSDGQSEPV